MNIITEYTKNYLKQNKKDKATAFAIIAASAMLTAVGVFHASLIQMVQNAGRQTRGDVIMIIAFMSQGGLLLLLVSAVFIFLLSNIFKILSYKRIRELGLLKTLGADPKNIKKTVSLEAVFIGIIPIFIGMGLGTGIFFVIVHIINRLNLPQESFKNIGLESTIQLPLIYNPVCYIPVFLFALFTVFMAVKKPAKKISGYTPIYALKGFIDIHKKKKRYSRLWQKEFYKNNTHYFKPVSRIIASSYILLSYLLSSLGFFTLNIDYKTPDINYNLQVRIDEIEGEKLIPLFKELKMLNGVQDAYIGSNIYFFTELDSKAFSEKFMHHNKNNNFFNSHKIKGDMYKLKIGCIGIDKEHFNRLIDDNNLSQSANAVLINRIKQTVYEPYNNPVTIPFFDAGLKNITLHTENQNIIKTINITMLNKYPKTIALKPLNYFIFLVMPIEKIEQFYNEGSADYRNKFYTFNFKIEKKAFLDTAALISNNLRQNISAKKLYIYNDEIEKTDRIAVAKKARIIFFTVMCFLLFLTIINAYCAITLSLENRKKEIAGMMSLGLSKKNIKKIFIQEAFLHSVFSFFKALPFCILVIYIYFRTITYFTFYKFISGFNYVFVFIYITLLVFSIFGIYFLNLKKIVRAELISVIKNEV